MLPTATLKKKSIKKREDESLVRKMQELMSSRPCGTLLNILNIVWGGWGGGDENRLSQLKTRESLSSVQIL